MLSLALRPHAVQYPERQPKIKGGGGEEQGKWTRGVVAAPPAPHCPASCNAVNGQEGGGVEEQGSRLVVFSLSPWPHTVWYPATQLKAEGEGVEGNGGGTPIPGEEQGGGCEVLVLKMRVD